MIYIIKLERGTKQGRCPFFGGDTTEFHYELYSDRVGHWRLREYALGMDDLCHSIILPIITYDSGYSKQVGSLGLSETLEDAENELGIVFIPVLSDGRIIVDEETADEMFGDAPQQIGERPTVAEKNANQMHIYNPPLEECI